MKNEIFLFFVRLQCLLVRTISVVVMVINRSVPLSDVGNWQIFLEILFSCRRAHTLSLRIQPTALEK